MTKQTSWTSEQMENALAAYAKGEVSVRQVRQRFGIPPITFLRRCRARKIAIRPTGCHDPSEETRSRMSESAKARCDAEWRANRSAAKLTKLPEQQIRELYEAGKTQAEIAEAMGVSQKVVWRFMQRRNIQSRGPFRFEQKPGEANSNWIGDDATYAAFHARVEAIYGKPPLCAHCQATEGRFEWANLTGHYEDVKDYIRLCLSCHRRFDATRRKITGKPTSTHVRKTRKEVPHA